MVSSSVSEIFDTSRLTLKKVKTGRVLSYYEYQARLDNVVVGRLMFRYEAAQRHFRSQATAVHKDFQQKGIGTWLWRKTLKSIKPSAVSVTCASLGGLRMIKKVKKMFPHIDWEIL